MQSDHKEIEVNAAKLLSKKIVDAAKIKDEKSISAALFQSSQKAGAIVSV